MKWQYGSESRSVVGCDSKLCGSMPAQMPLSIIAWFFLSRLFARWATSLWALWMQEMGKMLAMQRIRQRQQHPRTPNDHFCFAYSQSIVHMVALPTRWACRAQRFTLHLHLMPEMSSLRLRRQRQMHTIEPYESNVNAPFGWTMLQKSTQLLGRDRVH